MCGESRLQCRVTLALSLEGQETKLLFTPRKKWVYGAEGGKQGGGGGVQGGQTLLWWCLCVISMCTASTGIQYSTYICEAA